MRRYRKEELDLRRDRMAEAIAESNDRNLWREVKKMAPHKGNPPAIDDETEDEAIAQIFANKYEALFNSVPPDEGQMASIGHQVDALLQNISNEDVSVSEEEVAVAIKRLKANKHDGRQAMWSNFILWAPRSMVIRLSSLIEAMLSHGYSPEGLNLAVVHPIPKKGDLCNSDNYRGIALSSCIAKLTELVLMAKSRDQIGTSELQFAYKKGHSTAMCTLMLKEIVTHYFNRGSDVYACFIDASKAFDRLRHDALFDILIERHVPPAVIRILLASYRNQHMCVRWRTMSSEKFKTENGVK